MTKQPEVQIADLKIGQAVRITFIRPDNSWREVIWNVQYADERSAILKPVIGWKYDDADLRIFDVDQVKFWDAEALVEALSGCAK